MYWGIGTSVVDVRRARCAASPRPTPHGAGFRPAAGNRVELGALPLRGGGAARAGRREALEQRIDQPLVAAAREPGEHGQQLAGALGELVVDARRNLAVALAREEAVGDHAVEPRAELLGRDARKDPLELDEPPGAGREVADDQQRPLVAD